MTLREMLALAGDGALDKEVKLLTVGDELCSVYSVLDETETTIVFSEKDE